MRNQKTYTKKEAIIALERYCAYQDRSQKEVDEKLNNLDLKEEEKFEIVSHLMAEKYLDEERFAKSYARGKFNNNKWGKSKIIQGLGQHDISGYLLQEALKEISDDSYKKTIAVLIENKLRTLQKEEAFKRFQKVSRYLQSKGYAYNDFKDELDRLNQNL